MAIDLTDPGVVVGTQTDNLSKKFMRAVAEVTMDELGVLNISHTPDGSPPVTLIEGTVPAGGSPPRTWKTTIVVYVEESPVAP